MGDLRSYELNFRESGQLWGLWRELKETKPGTDARHSLKMELGEFLNGLPKGGVTDSAHRLGVAVGTLQTGYAKYYREHRQ